MDTSHFKNIKMVSLFVYATAIINYIVTWELKWSILLFMWPAFIGIYDARLYAFHIWLIPFEIICYQYLYKVKSNNKIPDDVYKLNYYHNYNINTEEFDFKCHKCTLKRSQSNSIIYGESVSILEC